VQALAAAAPSVPRVVKGALSTELVPEAPPELLARLQSYLNVRRASLAGWDAGGTGVYVLTQLGNVPQLHRVDQPLGMRRQLTFGSEGVDAFSPSPDPQRPGGIASADEGGNEYTQLYWLDARGNRRLLTDGASRNGSPVWSSDGRRLAFHSTRRNSRDFDLWTLDMTQPEAAPELAYEASGLWTPLDWSPKGDRLLVTHDVSETKNELFVLDPRKGLGPRIAPGAQPPAGAAHKDVAISGAVFDATGEGVFYLSDAGGEYRGLWYRDLATGKDRLLTPDTRWDYEELVISPDRQRLALALNEGGWSRLRVYDVRQQRFLPDPQLPRTVVYDLRFSRDGRQLAFTSEQARVPGDAYVLDLARNRLTRWTESETGQLDPSTFHEPRLIEYATFDGKQIPALVVEPSGSQPHGVLISIHGGPEGQSRPRFNALVEYLVSELGLSVIQPNVRGSTGYGRSYTLLDNAERREDSVRDIGALLDWISKQPQLDGRRVAVMGGSYGGYMTLATATNYPDRIAAAIDLVGISNFVTFLESTKEYRRDLRRVEYGDERQPAMRELLERISPLTNAAKIRAPLFVVQGQNDPRVPLAEAEQIVRKVREQGREVWYMLAADEGHGFQKKENRDAFTAAAVQFLERQLVQPR
jgi:dipeptidyl aminopeptidase/acylaminoacyl peptidase